MNLLQALTAPDRADGCIELIIRAILLALRMISKRRACLLTTINPTSRLELFVDELCSCLKRAIFNCLTSADKETSSVQIEVKGYLRRGLLMSVATSVDACTSFPRVYNSLCTLARELEHDGEEIELSSGDDNGNDTVKGKSTAVNV
jgi:hypothetical protein